MKKEVVAMLLAGGQGSRLYVLRDGRLEEIPAGLGPKELIASFHPPKVGI